MQGVADTYKWNYVWADLTETWPILVNNWNWNLWERRAFLFTFLDIFCTCKTPSFLRCSFKALDIARQILWRELWGENEICWVFPKCFLGCNCAMIAAFPISLAQLYNQASSAHVNVLAVVFLSMEYINNINYNLNNNLLCFSLYCMAKYKIYNWNL